MSYAFDVSIVAWEHLRKQLPPEQRDGEVAMRFGFFLEELHDANHRLNDAVNKDGRVTEFAHKLRTAVLKATGEG